MAGIWGKLRGHGDFLAVGLEPRIRAFFVPWLDTSLAGLREEWNADWEERFDAMAPLAFWIGPGLSGDAGPIAGVMMASGDKIGRRYPLVLLGRGEAAPPMLMPTDFHKTATEVLAQLLEKGTLDAADWPRPLGEADPYRGLTDQDDPSLVWAHNPSRPGASLMHEIMQFDHAAACTGRAYFWTAHHQGPGIALACNGLPGTRALGWLIEASQAADPGRAGAPIEAPEEIIRAASLKIPPPSGQGVLRLGQEHRINAAEEAWDAKPGASSVSEGRLILRPDWSIAEGAAGGKADLWQASDDWSKGATQPEGDGSDTEARIRPSRDREDS